MVKQILDRIVVFVQTGKTDHCKTEKPVLGLIYLRNNVGGTLLYVLLPICMVYEIGVEVVLHSN